jgi:flagellar protein FliJ
MPAGFEFRLQPLLDQHKHAEDEKQRNFAACGLGLDESRRELDRLIDARRAHTKELAEAARLRSAVELRLRDSHLRYLDDAIDAERSRFVELEAACQCAREELIVASRKRRVIEKLKERRRQAFEAEDARREELELDDVNARRYERAARERLTEGRAERAAP